MKILKFKNNDEMPALGLGTWKSNPGEVKNAVKMAIKAGYRHIDCAFIYGNEAEIGQALSECFSEGLVTREELWITSKLWNDAHAKADVIPALKTSLSNLQLDYLDLYLIHWPIALKKGTFRPQSSDDQVSLEDCPISETWGAMEEANRQGLAKHIGVSNFGKKSLEKLLPAATIKPEMNQVEIHPYMQQEDLIAFCKTKDIHITAYAPLGSMDRPEGLKASDEPVLLEDPVIVELAKAKNASPAQVLISWALHRSTAVIPKSANPERIKQNLDSAQLSLTQSEMNAISALEKNRRYVNGDFWVMEGGPYTLENIWA